MIKSIVLGIVLVVSMSSVVHAQDNKGKENGAKVEKKQKKTQEEKPTYMDLSGPEEKDDGMPAITPKGKL